ncbi:hypothetical protein RE474_05520 [Methanolobus sediminis]|uniref:DUF4367 domain-containing protein n=1 Tax=Methanolobus sediminis TaxID=3072978 RepID=A0AA51YN18_9EURY|nr:hypothetical protein [Methanolobus sediminis]WMW26173.1 hypothetical protein RE474_05520 [Methanolobus sediminis]
MKKMILVLILSILMLSISGCTDEVVEETPASSAGSITDSETTADLVPIDNLPENYELLGIRDLSAETVGSEYAVVEGIVGGSEGLYTNAESTDVYVDVIETNSAENAEEFINAYKGEFSDLAVGDRFTDVSINGHSAVQILDYVIVGMEDAKRYTYIWSNGKFVFVVGGATEDSEVLLTLAESTGY